MAERKYLNNSGLSYLWSKIVAKIPTNNNQLTNGAGYQTASDVSSAIPSYTLSINGNRITLTPSSGTSSYIDLPVYGGETS